MFLVVDCQLFPCVDYLKKLIEFEYVKIEQYDTFQKMTFRNKYMISGANGISKMSVPIAGGREQKKLMREVEIDYTSSWPVTHWRGIVSAYSKAPFFEFYSKDIYDLLFAGERFLFTFNLKIISWIFKTLKANTSIELTGSFVKEYNNDRDLRNYFLPKNYQNDSLNWSPRYLQVFEDRFGFQPNLSILDLLFCEGPNSLNLLKQAIKQNL